MSLTWKTVLENEFFQLMNLRGFIHNIYAEEYFFQIACFSNNK